MDLRKLRHTMVLAKELNFARAAEALHLTQPALSRSILALEDELGCRLFDRDGRGVRITPMGQVVVERARTLLMDARSLQQEVDMLLRHEVGHVRMGAGPLPLSSLLPPVMAELAQQHPGLHIEVESHSSTVLMQMLLDGAIEFFVAETSTYTDDPRVTVQALVKDSMRAYVRASHPLAGREQLSPQELLHHPVLANRRSTLAEHALAKYLGLPATQRVPVHLKSDFVPLLIHVALHSDAVLLCVHTAVRAELQRGALVQLDLSPPLGRVFHVGIVSLAGWTLSPAAQWLMERLQHAAQ